MGSHQNTLITNDCQQVKWAMITLVSNKLTIRLRWHWLGNTTGSILSKYWRMLQPLALPSRKISGYTCIVSDEKRRLRTQRKKNRNREQSFRPDISWVYIDRRSDNATTWARLSAGPRTTDEHAWWWLQQLGHNKRAQLDNARWNQLQFSTSQSQLSSWRVSRSPCQPYRQLCGSGNSGHQRRRSKWRHITWRVTTTQVTDGDQGEVMH